MSFTLVKPPREPSIVVGIERMTARVDELEFPIRARVRECEIAVLVPCFNEELTVGKTVAEFREALPSAMVYVYDNNSTDRTLDVARAAGAIVRSEPRQGKGTLCVHVCRHRRRHLCAGGRRRDLRGPRRRADGSTSDRRKSGLRQWRASVPEHGSLSKRPSLW